MGLYIQHNETKFKVGDVIKVHQRIVEGGKERIQAFEGLVIKVKGQNGEKSFTVRKISSGIGVERVWPVDSPFIQKIDVVTEGEPSRAKLYYLRTRTGRLALKVKTKNGTKVANGTTSAAEPAKEVKSETSEPTAAEETVGENGGESGEDTSAK